MRPIEDVARHVKNVNIIVSPEVNKKVFDNTMQAFRQSEAKQSPLPERTMWRVIVQGARSRKLKVAITVIVFIALLGFVPFNGRTAFGRIADELAITMARLKAMVLGKELHETEHVDRQINRTVRILTKSCVYSSPDISSLERFLSERNVALVAGDSGNAKYAVISFEVVAALQRFLKSSDTYDIVASPSVLNYAGAEAMIAVVNTAGAAMSAMQDEEGNLRLDFAFHNGQDGCDISQIELARGEGLLISGIRTIQHESSEELMTVLVLPEVIQD
jgi:hypothetical protein